MQLVTTMGSRALVVASLLLFVTGTDAWVNNAFLTSSNRIRVSSTPTSLSMAMDYNDPVVAQEFAKVQPMTYEEVQEELQESGIPVPPTMNDMEVKLMLVEMRLRLSGQLGGQAAKAQQRPATFSSKFEEALWTKPAFEEFYNELKRQDDHNAQNVVAEFLNHPDQARQRYGKDYRGLLRKTEQALNAPPPVKSATLTFSGFPSNMGEAGLQMTLQALGDIAEFECEQDDTFPILKGTVTFEDIESAKKAVEQYNGMDMGMGTQLEMVSA